MLEYYYLLNIWHSGCRASIMNPKIPSSLWVREVFQSERKPPSIMICPRYTEPPVVVVKSYLSQIILT